MQSNNMPPTYYAHQAPDHAPPGALLGRGYHQMNHQPPIHAVVPSRRPAEEDDDDVQFISEKPVKRHRIDERQLVTATAPVLQAPLPPSAITTGPIIVPNIPTATMELPGGELNDAERRLSTGMVGLLSDFHTVELAYALRGVSMPMLENFAFDQPFRRHRPLSPPELSPKQLPSTISPATPNVPGSGATLEVSGSMKPSDLSVARTTPSNTSPEVKRPVPALVPDLTRTIQTTNQLRISQKPGHMKNCPAPVSQSQSKKIGPKDTNNPPRATPALPRAEAAHTSSSNDTSNQPEGNNHLNNTSAPPQKQPCQVCARMRHQAPFPRAQVMPMAKAALPLHLQPQLHYHAPYGQHMHPHMMAPPTSNVHQFGHNFSPAMMPVGGNSSMPPPSPSQSHTPPQPVTPRQEGVDKDKQSAPEQSKPTEPPQVTEPKSPASSPKATPQSQIKPPAFLIQPTYRKPSPNLIVDVAETCQEKFPFEEVAKRHNVTVDKVFEVFAAIIKVPLLRCPTDRRRPGRLATTRIKEYNKAKKDIQDSRTDKPDAAEQEPTVDATDVAQKLGQVEFPEGFTLSRKT
ncbi:hypothetical protein F4777DRAFT_474456 [Nemania sp. FL0916]|nr:hypothetical protein F4777DRAFT_474456 [Nemania sp. FL0916]